MLQRSRAGISPLTRQLLTCTCPSTSKRTLTVPAHRASLPRHLRYRTMSSQPAFRLDAPSVADEQKAFEAATKSVQDWWATPRFAGVKRPYDAAAVSSKRGSLPIEENNPVNIQAKKLHALLSRAAKEGKPIHTMGAIDPVQMSQMAKHQEVVYVSGWACSSVLTTANNDVGPDLADYPYTTGE